MSIIDLEAKRRVEVAALKAKTAMYEARVAQLRREVQQQMAEAKVQQAWFRAFAGGGCSRSTSPAGALSR